MNKYQEYVRSKLTDRDLLEQLAEEASELAQASLKLIRASGMNNNATPVGSVIAMSNFLEECKDVISCIALFCGNELDEEDSPKIERWAKRLGYEDDQ